ncbi:hypothetical protein DEO72_LG9g3 [Vigna unguiculata]|uniref:Uncharacterized protein n=1 Tax=Vigna unguiculata TaxID=3917 RepID=A0A4D6MUA9_VIGUN|nr:hypothetical protein DEO72_LG9g3 [Vigna unguiculata]
MDASKENRLPSSDLQGHPRMEENLKPIHHRKSKGHTVLHHQPPHPHVTKKQNMLVPNPSYDLDYETIAIDDDDDVGDNAVPEFVKHIEAMPDEIDRILSL